MSIKVVMFQVLRGLYYAAVVFTGRKLSVLGLHKFPSNMSLKWLQKCWVS